MGSRDKFYSIVSAEHGIDDVGLSQPTGAVNSVEDAGNAYPRYAGKLLMNIVTAATPLRAGMAIRTISLVSAHTALSRILKVLNNNKLIVNIPFVTGSTAGTTGNWAMDGGANNWDALMPMGSDIPAGNVAMTYFEGGYQGAFGGTGGTYIAGKIYPFPGGIKTVQVSGAGNVRLFRGATNKRKGATGSA